MNRIKSKTYRELKKYNSGQEESEDAELKIIKIREETQLAILIDIKVAKDGMLDDGVRTLWIPKSMIVENYYNADKTIVIKGWFFDQLMQEGKI